MQPVAYEGEHGDPNPPSIVLHGRSAWNPYRQASIAAVANPDAPVPTEDIARAILVLRGQRVILDRELAAIYGVSTGRLNEAVKRNAERFPADFMFQLTAQEIENLKSQFAISSWIAEALNSPASVICPRSGACPRQPQGCV